MLILSAYLIIFKHILVKKAITIKILIFIPLKKLPKNS